ncbi:MAG: hypothetical protein HY289_06120 [Planctomycetes bacterium]|nr:hypothetical protein [Planctomycetota bacterium]
MNTPAVKKRHALKLPAGSVRAIHVLAIVGLTCAIVLIPGKELTIPPYLIYLLFMMIGHYFAAHGVTIAEGDDPGERPLNLRGGSVRFLVIVALTACIAFKIYYNQDDFYGKFENSLKLLKDQPFLPLAILGGFLLGAIVRAIVGRNPPAIWQDFEAWASFIALIGLAIAALIHLVIEPSTEAMLMIPTWDACLGGMIAFYFGERS